MEDPSAGSGLGQDNAMALHSWGSGLEGLGGMAWAWACCATPCDAVRQTRLAEASCACVPVPWTGEGFWCRCLRPFAVNRSFTRLPTRGCSEFSVDAGRCTHSSPRLFNQQLVPCMPHDVGEPRPAVCWCFQETEAKVARATARAECGCEGSASTPLACFGPTVGSVAGGGPMRLGALVVSLTARLCLTAVSCTAPSGGLLRRPPDINGGVCKWGLPSLPPPTYGDLLSCLYRGVPCQRSQWAAVNGRWLAGWS